VIAIEGPEEEKNSTVFWGRRPRRVPARNKHAQRYAPGPDLGDQGRMGEHENCRVGIQLRDSEKKGAEERETNLVLLAEWYDRIVCREEKERHHRGIALLRDASRPKGG